MLLTLKICRSENEHNKSVVCLTMSHINFYVSLKKVKVFCINGVHNCITLQHFQSPMKKCILLQKHKNDENETDRNKRQRKGTKCKF